MNDYEQHIAEEFRKAVNEWSNSTERSEQAKEFRLGPSDIGYCSERVRRMLDQQVPEDEVEWNKAFIGTVLGDGLETAIQKRWPHAKTQVTLTVTLETSTRRFVMDGHSDVIVPTEGLVLDIKMKNGLNYIRRQDTADQGYQFQRHLYALGAFQSGLFPGLELEDIKVGNVYYDRSGVEAVPHVQIEPFSWDVIHEATEWLEEVVYNFLHNEEARKEPAREVCESTCGFFTKCRAYDTDVEGLITDEKYIGAIDMYADGTQMISRGKKLQNEAKIMLQGVSGHTATKTLRWVQVNGGPVSYMQEPYLKISLTKRK